MLGGAARPKPTLFAHPSCFCLCRLSRSCSILTPTASFVLFISVAVLPCPVLSRPVLSCPVLSCPAASIPPPPPPSPSLCRFFFSFPPTSASIGDHARALLQQNVSRQTILRRRSVGAFFVSRRSVRSGVVLCHLLASTSSCTIGSFRCGGAGGGGTAFPADIRFSRRRRRRRRWRLPHFPQRNR